jgi:hypothetical protein
MLKVAATYLLLNIIFRTEVEISTANHEGHIW